MIKLVAVLCILGAAWALPTKDLHPDTGLPLDELVRRHGYPFEEHEITTSDGYILKLHRIPHGIDNADVEDRPVALLMHCLTCSSGVFAAYGPENGLAFILADKGYDVWMPNHRGNMYSRRHTEYDPDVDKEQFWSFSWHHVGVTDIPESIDYILDRTGREDLFYLGFSQGTTTFYVMAAERPEYNAKIRLSVLLAPIGYMSNLSNPILQIISRYVDELEILGELIGLWEFAPNLSAMDELAEACKETSDLGEFCENFFFYIFGQDSVQMEENILPVFATHVPAGSSVKQWVHYGQEIQSGKFRQFDYGLVGNLEIHGSINPPNYDTSAITAPVALYYGESDSFAAIVDVQQMANELPNVVKNHLIPDPTFTHIDFVLSKNVVELVYDDVVELMSQF